MGIKNTMLKSLASPQLVLTTPKSTKALHLWYLPLLALSKHIFASNCSVFNNTSEYTTTVCKVNSVFSILYRSIKIGMFNY